MFPRRACRRFLAAAVAAAGCALALTVCWPAQAEGGQKRLFVGMRLSPFRFHTWREEDPVLPSWGQFDWFVGVKLMPNLSLLAGADYASHNVRTTSSFLAAGDVDDRRISAFTPHLALRLTTRATSDNPVAMYIALLASRT